MLDLFLLKLILNKFILFKILWYIFNNFRKFFYHVSRKKIKNIFNIKNIQFNRNSVFSFFSFQKNDFFYLMTYMCI